MKYLVVTGGVVSGLGKGISISSLGVLLKAHGLRCTSIKVDPYLNIDAGTMSPFEHGEVFVLNDGGECDLDIGNYERFLDITLTRDHNITTGKVYNQVIQAERRGDYLGKTVQVIPHVTDAIQDWIERVAHLPTDGASNMYSGAAGGAGGRGEDGLPSEPDLCLIELGGTVGDIESLVFLEALRQFAARVGHDNIMFVHVSLVPVLGSVGEQKTKPTQHSVKELRSVGINPDVIICRSSKPLHSSTKDKLALFCQVPSDHMLTVADVTNIYHVPLMLEAQGAVGIIARRLKLSFSEAAPALAKWREVAEVVDTMTEEVRIALVGKYTGLQDSYLSVIKSLQHAAIAARKRLVIEWIDAAALEPASEKEDPEAFRESWETLKASHGVLVPGGFGDRGVEGKIQAIKYAREARKPFFGICLGMQCAVIEYARSKLGLAGANSAEFNPSAPHKVIVFMPEISTTHMGGTMRLGARPTVLRAKAPRAAAAGAVAGAAAASPDDDRTLAAELYGRDVKAIWERHRHRYEVNPEYVGPLQGAGLHFTGTDDRGVRMEIVELDRREHPFFFAVQYHPEFQSHPHRPSPPFLGLIYAAAGQLDGNLPLPIAADRRAKGLALGGAAAGSVTGGLTAPGSPARSASGTASPALGGASAASAASGSPAGLRSRSVSSSSAVSAGAAGAAAFGQQLTGDGMGSSAVVAPIEASPMRPVASGTSGKAHPPPVSELLGAPAGSS